MNPYYYPYDPSFYVFSTLLTTALLIAWGFICWHLLTKAGYRNLSRLGMLLVMFAFPPLGFVLFVVMPWPVEKKIDKLSQRLYEIENSLRFSPMSGNVEAELNKLKAEMGLNQMKDPKKKTPW